MDFFRRGVTRACLKESGTFPEERDSFMIDVITGRIKSRFERRSEVGRGSKSHDFGGDDFMISATSSSVTSLKDLN